MTKNTSNLIKFSICTLAGIGSLWLTTVDKWEIGHAIVLVLCLSTFLWYGIHVFTDNPDKEVNKDKQDKTLN